MSPLPVFSRIWLQQGGTTAFFRLQIWSIVESGVESLIFGDAVECDAIAEVTLTETSHSIIARRSRRTIKRIVGVVSDASLSAISATLPSGYLTIPNRRISCGNLLKRDPVVSGPGGVGPNTAPTLHPDGRYTYLLEEWWDCTETLLSRMVDRESLIPAGELISTISGLRLTTAPDRVGNFLVYRLCSHWHIQMRLSHVSRSLWFRPLHPLPLPSPAPTLTLRLQLQSGNEVVDERIVSLPVGGVSIPVKNFPNTFSVSLFDGSGNLLAHESGGLLSGVGYTRTGSSISARLRDSTGKGHRVAWTQWHGPPAPRLDPSRPWVSRTSTRRSFNQKALERLRVDLFRENQRQAAVSRLRELLRTLETAELCIWDPYLDPSAVQDFLGWVHPSTKVRILCGRSANNTTDLTRYQTAIGTALSALRTGTPPRTIECKFRSVPRGAQFFPIYHDRCLLADDAAWALGSSLNSIGNKWALVIQLLDPAHLKRLFDREWAIAAGPRAGFVEAIL